MSASSKPALPALADKTCIHCKCTYPAEDKSCPRCADVYFKLCRTDDLRPSLDTVCTALREYVLLSALLKANIAELTERRDHAQKMIGCIIGAQNVALYRVYHKDFRDIYCPTKMLAGKVKAYIDSVTRCDVAYIETISKPAPAIYEVFAMPNFLTEVSKEVVRRFELSKQ